MRGAPTSTASQTGVGVTSTSWGPGAYVEGVLPPWARDPIQPKALLGVGDGQSPRGQAVTRRRDQIVVQESQLGLV